MSRTSQSRSGAINSDWTNALAVPARDPRAIAVDSPFLAPFDGSFRLKDFSSEAPDDGLKKEQRRGRLAEIAAEIGELQTRMYADNRYSFFSMVQARNGAGKDGFVKEVYSGVQPVGITVHSYKAPTSLELDHDFMWRHNTALPERGRFGVHVRSWYEELTTVRVHPEFLRGQRLPDMPDLDALWAQRIEDIVTHEKYLARNGYVITKFFLHISKDEQVKQLLQRVDDPAKHWKANPGDMDDQVNWSKHDQAFEETIRQTSRPWAPWYCIPANSRSSMQLAGATIVRDTLVPLQLEYPKITEDARAELQEMGRRLRALLPD